MGVSKLQEGRKEGEREGKGREQEEGERKKERKKERKGRSIFLSIYLISISMPCLAYCNGNAVEEGEGRELRGKGES